MSFFFFNDTATTEIYTLSLHDALPISCRASISAWLSMMPVLGECSAAAQCSAGSMARASAPSSQRRSWTPLRSEEHTSELQSRLHLVCRLLLEKKKMIARLDSARVSYD